MKTKHHTTNNGGYIALMATIIISLVLLVMIVNEGFSGWMTRFSVLGTEAKEQANALAEGCADQALASLITDPSYLGNTTSHTPGGDCKVFAISQADLDAGLVTLKTQASVRDAFANLELLQNVNNIHLGSIPTAPNYGTLLVQTAVNNPSSGAQLQPSDFTMHVASVNPSKTSFAGSLSGVVVTIPTNGGTVAYSISEGAVPGYAASYSSLCSGSLSGGQVKNCTVTNNPVTTTLTVIVNVNNNDGTGSSQPSDIPLYIDGAAAQLGKAVDVSSGSHTVSATVPSGYFSSPWGYQCASGGTVSLNLGDHKICVVTLDDIPPPAPTCAETVMMLDRTGSMSSTDLNNEKAAANALVSLYAGVKPPAPLPHLGVGSFGAYPNASLPAGAASVPANGTLSTAYATLTSLINSMLNGNSSVGTDLSAAINSGVAELNAHGQSGKEKVLILVSDGDPSQPTSGAALSTGFFAPTGNAQDSTGELWSNPQNAYTDGAGAASDPVSDNDQHRFYSFNFPVIPSTATITGIEVKADVWATTSAQVTGPTQNIQKAPSAAAAPNQWSTASAGLSSDNTYTTSATLNQQQGYGTFGFSIPSNATITGIQVTTEAKVSGTGTSGTTPTLYPSGTGNYTQWGGGNYTGLNESSNFNCSNSGEYINTNTSGARASYDLSLGNIPDGSTITNITITPYDRGDSSSGGAYRVFVRLNGTNTDGSTLYTTTSTSGCNARTPQAISLSSVKSGSTAIEIGALKVNNGGSTNNSVRIGAFSATITYVNPVTGSISLALSSNSGSSWTSVSRTVSLDSSESVDVPAGNGTSDLWNRTWVPGDFADGKFLVRVQNTSPTGVTTMLDQTQVQVFYNVPTQAPVACTLGIDLSWNGGSSWTGEKTQTLTSNETTYTLGSQSDDWGSHTWSPSEFVNGSTKFLARIHASDPGSNCDNASVENVDFLQAQVHYTVPVSASEAALTAADAAKNSNVNIFTIHFGDTSGRTLLAQLANGTTPNSPHNPGSLNDPTGFTTGNTGTISPTSNSADTGGAGNGFEGNPTGAYGNSGTTATNANGIGDRHRYYGYNFSLPPGAIINGIVARTDWWTNSTNGTNSINVELSWDGGATWTAAKTQGTESTTDSNSKTVGSSSDTWGRTWSVSDLGATNFYVRVTTNCSGGGTSCSSRTFLLDWLPITVYYTVNTENGDGDNFFIAPTSADMKGIFEFIGNQVCPAINNVAAANPPTTASLLVITQVINNNSGASVAGDFTDHVTGGNPSLNNFAGDTSGKMVTVDPGSYSVTQSAAPAGYTTTSTDSCSSSGSAGAITAGETRVCILTNDDIPPPPPPPNLTITPGSWQEVPDTNP
jgi:hypothetical protein